MELAEVIFTTERIPPTPTPPTSKEHNMTQQTHAAEPTKTVIAGGIDLASVRLPTNYGATLGVQKVVATVPVGKPKKGTFFRVRAGVDWMVSIFVYVHPVNGDVYLVTPEAANLLGGLVRGVSLHVAVDRQGNPFLVPVPLPAEDGSRNPWHQSLALAVDHATKKWVRIESNRSAGSYTILEAQGSLPEPDWPALSLADLVSVAFRNKVVADADSPVVKEALGVA